MYRGNQRNQMCVIDWKFMCMNYLFSACNCDTRGSIDDAICDSHSDVAAGLLAGRCHCKINVDGLKCDRCKAGYWNFTADNPEGCQGKNLFH